MDQQQYVRSKIAEVAETRGGIALVASETKTDQRTIRAILSEKHRTNMKTLCTLADYFKKADKRAAKETV